MKENSLRIRTVAPSGQFSWENYQKGVLWLRDLGAEIVSEAKLRSSDMLNLNGSDQERLDELQEALCDESCDVVWVARGGYGLIRIIERLDLSHVRKIPLVIGFSDVTVLLAHLWTRYYRTSLHGPILTRLSQEPESVLQALQLILNKQSQMVSYPKFFVACGDSPKNIEGNVIPANLCMLQHLIGTPSMPNLENSILFFEEVNEHPYQIDRMLTHLQMSNSLDGVKGVVLGYFMQTPETDNFQDEVKQVFCAKFSSLNIPVFSGFAFGHKSPNWPLPFGAQVVIEVNGQEAQLFIREEVLL